MTKIFSSKYRKKDIREGLFSILPAMAIVLSVRAYPVVAAFLKSFTDWDGMFKNSFIGFRNYSYLLSSGDFWVLIRNTMIVLINVPLQIFVGIAVAVLLFEKSLGWKFFRAVYYLPQVISMVVVGYLFAIFFSYYGPINAVLRMVNLDRMAIEWLGSGITALPIIILCLVWINIGWQGIIMLGGLSAIDSSLFDAAKLDGVSYFQRLAYIYFPLLVRVIEYSMIISIVWSFTGLFPIIFSITSGGPGYQTTTIDYMIYLKAFVVGNRLGEACALAMILLAIVMILTRLQMYISDKRDNWR
ncbi:MAG: sugar ABC transporter permease [Spirochaetia bacterium]|nr:sugar ABC transporter permease [Spirochaetia bacterium]